MTLKELCEKWRYQSDELNSFAQTERALKELCAVIENVLEADGEIPLPGIGKLKVKNVPAKTGRNPQTGKQINIPAKRKVVLAASKALLDKLNA